MEKEGHQLALIAGFVALIAIFALYSNVAHPPIGEAYQNNLNQYSDYRSGSSCNDGIDNDKDKDTDWPRDDGCVSRGDVSENQLGKGCDDGLDNDENGRIDYPDDAGCTSTEDRSESSNLRFAGCVDSDGGHQSTKSGTVNVFSSLQSSPFKDRCYSNYVLIEYVCSQGKATFTLVKCDTGVCRDGACVSSPLQDFSAKR